ncbi:MAG: AAA family ATPase [Cyanobacteria bacterium]|nr:AAA family ATPase [Cyanobacteriota bacterium]
MLKHLSIKHIGIIDGLSLEVRPGFTAVTGETGSGKSLILWSVALVFGLKATPQEVIQTGYTDACVELEWAIAEGIRPQVSAILEAAGISDSPEESLLETNLLLSREWRGQQSRYRINGVPVSKDVMAQLQPLLLEIQHQHEMIQLFSPSEQRQYLDQLSLDRLNPLKKKLSRVYHQWCEAQRQLETIEATQQQRLRERDFMQHQLNELEAAALENPEEDVLLEAKAQRFQHFEELSKHLGGCLDGRLLDHIASIKKSLKAAAGLDASLQPYFATFEMIEAEAQEAQHGLSRYQDQLPRDIAQLDELIHRLETLKQLKRKYGPTLARVIETQTQLALDLESSAYYEQDQQTLLAHRDSLAAEIAGLCEQMTQERHLCKQRLEKMIRPHLKDLALTHARFEVQMTALSEWSADGMDGISFQFSANPGEPLRPLNKAASGGELSRVLLAIKVVCHGEDTGKTVIFDEVDTGISGPSAKCLAEKLQQLSQTHQVLAVTHQAIVAAAAHSHVNVEKTTEKNTKKEEKVRVQAVYLEEKEKRLSVLSRLASGIDTVDKTMVPFVERLVASVNKPQRENQG